MAYKALPPVEVLRQLLRYEPETGKLFWLPRSEDQHAGARQWNARLAGKPAFTAPDVAGYLKGCIFNNVYAAHRVAWALHHGEQPPEQIDHINRIRSDNRILNLRTVTQSENMRNRPKSKVNKSGHTGVSWSALQNKWVATINHGGKQQHIGVFDFLLDAVAARKAAEDRYGYHPNHGR